MRTFHATCGSPRRRSPRTGMRPVPTDSIGAHTRRPTTPKCTAVRNYMMHMLRNASIIAQAGGGHIRPSTPTRRRPSRMQETDIRSGRLRWLYWEPLESRPSRDPWDHGAVSSGRASIPLNVHTERLIPFPSAKQRTKGHDHRTQVAVKAVSRPRHRLHPHGVQSASCQGGQRGRAPGKHRQHLRRPISAPRRLGPINLRRWSLYEY